MFSLTLCALHWLDDIEEGGSLKEGIVGGVVWPCIGNTFPQLQQKIQLPGGNADWEKWRESQWTAWRGLGAPGAKIDREADVWDGVLILTAACPSVQPKQHQSSIPEWGRFCIFSISEQENQSPSHWSMRGPSTTGIHSWGTGLASGLSTHYEYCTAEN